MSMYGVDVWQKPLQYCKVISLQLTKVNEKRINEFKKIKYKEGISAICDNMKVCGRQYAL